VSIAKGPSASHGRSTYPSRRIRGWFPSISLQTSDRLACQRRVRRRRRIRRRRSFIPFMHGGRSPAPSRRYMPTRSRRRRFAATAESASDSGEQGPWIRASTRTGSDNHIRPRSRSAGIFVAARRLFGPFLHEPREPSVPSSGLGQRAIGWRDSAPSSARDSRPGRSRRSERRITRRRRASSTSSAISVTASRFLGPFLTQPSEPPTPESGMGQRRIGWRDRSLLSTGSAPVTPTSSRDSSLGGRGRSHKRYRSTSSSSMGIRGLFRRSRSASPSCDSSRDYGLQQMFASSAFSSTSSDYGLPRLFGSPRASSAPASSDYGLRRLFSAPTGSPASSEYGLGTLFVSTAASAASDYGLGRTFASPAASPAASSVSSFGMQRLFGD
jgi:hypothetical protein